MIDNKMLICTKAFISVGLINWDNKKSAVIFIVFLVNLFSRKYVVKTCRRKKRFILTRFFVWNQEKGTGS